MSNGQPDRLAATLALDESVERVRLVSPGRAKALAGLGIRTVRDLVTHFPRRYVDLSAKETVASAVIGSSCTIEGSVHEIKLKRPKPRLSLVEISLVDSTGLLMVTCFRQPWLMDQVKPGMRIAVAGKLEFNYGFKRMTNPYLEVLEGPNAAEGMIIPVHPACEKVSAAWMRRLVGNALDACAGLYDPLPLEIRAKYRLMSRGVALSSIHAPHSMEEVAEARRRLVYEELLLLELMLMSQGRERSAGREAVRHRTDGPRVRALAGALPFELTAEQEQAKADILGQLAAPTVANHMLLGDVGTGKTVVAAFALAAAADTQAQALLMAPTEVLARQHGKSLGPLLDAAGVSWDVLTGSTSAAEREAILDRLSDGLLDVLIGTHALLEDDVAPKRLSLAVIDEQQRFGVEQRAKLLSKGDAPDALFLTATPIPRTLALALFGGLTLSYIKHRPNDTAQRTTFVHQKADRGHAYDAAREALARGEQVYVVCPLIGQSGEERDAKASDGGAGGRRREADEEAYEYAAISIESDDDLAGDDVAAAAKEATYLQATVFADWNVELLHGRMRSAEKQAVMDRFRSGETQVLVATTVIEVGVDVPNATIMIVEDADRFGLSQLHQLRGRVGRGRLAAQVHLISASKSDAALTRLAAMERTDDGFELASYDLSLRREGDILGNRQHGASGLKLVNVVRDGKIIEAAHADAAAIIDEDPALEDAAHRPLAREMRRMFAGEHAVQGG
ncbi:ATP-dependent DNA helicase RecG [Paraeggerthella hongkongensis]|uniref:Probable DNA 3'-5' helicase RecG n=1 Tax=Paraeggerthella hongkongensis TaxID=230658 RepID=A0A3N0BKF7_9ACTN|nr:ATP-dependent DNA helicase RecG [Paraeggerthella hongkongensis]RNL48495.1 ATP-dependent DNA helicase RecG [Paraeggerthella hongkongensis]